ncbi:hypothetical protein [Nesterenkonia jeotgali]|uniref:Uncharacterized protein n=1 Tax=Nesterenkonia jeotgali TaxID=317018 RepID=A0A839FPK4_9MICC|nr:hypothetical protein [Nesterenkonia jeotgali]MBA8921345.1 hypothetical protein [Nesterenkonia jeotgali]
MSTRPTTLDAEQTMGRIQTDLCVLQRQLHQLHVTAPLEGPLAGQFRASRRRWFEVEYQAKSAMMLSRQALAMLNMFTSTSREDPGCTVPSSVRSESSSA